MLFPDFRQVSPLFVVLIALSTTSPSRADLVTIQNAGFEDITGQTVSNEFTLGTPVGWSLYDPNGVTSVAGTFTGTLFPNGTDFFNTTAPEGNRVSILFNRGAQGSGAYGYEQTLAATLQANTDYSLSVEVGNIQSGTSESGEFFNLDDFPGYRVELLAGGVVIAQDNNSLIITEGTFATSTVNFSVGAVHAQLGQTLGIRLLNLNVPATPSGPDLEVDFDNVTLDATGVPEPASLWLMSLGGIGMIVTLRRRRRMQPRSADQHNLIASAKHLDG